ncbi:MAG: hypothetical protein U9O82_03695 [Thermodesulfobacteriota bacterium]|nr:hypothetical protein [Thermodesulfobacteriota bacterium]
MKSFIQQKSSIFINLLVLTAIMLSSGGCAYFNSDSDGKIAATSSSIEEDMIQPFYPSNFRDIQVPGELKWDRKNSMSIKTASFAGGILCFKGRVEISSLTDFFTSSMKKDGWELVGSINYESVFLAFIKPSQTCMIKINETSFHTEVYIYITEDISKNRQSSENISTGRFRSDNADRGRIISENVRDSRF